MGVLRENITIEKNTYFYTTPELTKDHPRLKWTEKWDGNTRTGDFNNDSVNRMQEDVPNFLILPSAETYGFVKAYYYNSATQQIVQNQSICGASIIGYQGNVGNVPYTSTRTVSEMTISSNLPIFNSNIDALEWVNSGYTNTTKILNKSNVLPEVEHDKFIYNTFRAGTPTHAGVQWTGTETRVFERFTTSGDAVLYPENGGYRILNNGEIINCEFGNVDEFNYMQSFEFLVYSGLFYKAWDGLTLEAGIYATRDIDTNMYFMDSRENAEAYQNATTEEAKQIIAEQHATNYAQIQNGSYYEPTNATGTTETSTTFGQVTHEPAFQRAYVLGRGAIAEIKNALFDTTAGGLWEDIKKGLDMYGDNPIESIIDLSYYPFNIDDVITTGSAQNYVYFGGYKLDLQNSTVKQVVYPNGYIDLGTFTFKPSFNSWKDYTSKAYFYCPYIGVYELDITRYINKSITVRFYIDFDTRACMCILIAGGIMQDYFTGEIGVGQPMRATDFASYANTQLQTILGGGKSAATSTAGGIGAGMQLGGMVGGSLAGAVGAGALGGAGLVLGAGMTAFNLSQNNINKFNKTIGSATGTLNEFLPQYPYFIFELDNTQEPNNLQSLYGRPSDTGGALSMFSGFLQCSKVNVTCPKATEEEKREIEQFLLSGVYL